MTGLLLTLCSMRYALCDLLFAGPTFLGMPPKISIPKNYLVECCGLTPKSFSRSPVNGKQDLNRKNRVLAI